MAGGARIEVRGADTLAATSRAAARDLADMTRPNTRVGKDLAAATRGRAPRRSGRLAASTQAFPATYDTASVGSDLIYAGPIHGGWRAHNIEPQPYIDQTLASREGAVLAVYDEYVQHTINQIRGA